MSEKASKESQSSTVSHIPLASPRWDEGRGVTDPLLFRKEVDQIIRICVLEAEQGEILDKCHALPCGGHFARDITAQKNLQSGFYLPTLFRDCPK